MALAFLLSCRGTPEYEEHLRAGNATIETNPAEAKRQFERAVELGAEAQGNAGLGRAYEELRQYDEAAAHFERARAAAPDNASIRLALARIYLILGRNGDARTELAWVADRHPEELGGVLLLGAISNSKDNARENLVRLEQAHPNGKNPAPLEVEVVRAELYRMTGDTPAARDADRRSESAKLWQQGAAAELALVFKLRGRLDAARRLLLAVTQRNDTAAEPWLDLLEVELARRDGPGAEHAANGIPTLYRESARGLELLGRFALLRGAPDDAAARFAKALAKTAQDDGPTRTRLVFAHAEALTAEHDLEGALKDLEQLLKNDPKYLPARLARAGLWIKLGKSKAAHRDLTSLLEAHPKEGRVYELLVTALLADRHTQQAEELAKRYIATYPGRAAPEILLGTVLRARGDEAAALAHFERALQREPKSLAGFEALLETKLSQKGYDAAVALATPYAKRAKSWKLSVMLGDLHARHEHPARAAAAYLAATRHDAGAPTPWSKLGHLRATQGATREAVTALERATALRPSMADLKLLATLQLRGGNHRGALRAYVQLLHQNPNSVEALNNLAMLYAGPLRSPEKALQHARRAYELMPESMAVNDTYGWLLVQQGHKERKLALTLLTRAAAKLDTPEVNYHLAKAQLANGDRTTARKTLTRALAEAADFPGVVDARALLERLDKESASAAH